MDIDEVGTIWIGNDHELRFLGVVDKDGNPLGSGTATYELTKASNGLLVVGGTIPFDATTDNDYIGLIDKGSLITLINRAFYKLEVVFEKDGKDATYVQRYQARYRT